MDTKELVKEIGGKHFVKLIPLKILSVQYNILEQEIINMFRQFSLTPLKSTKANNWEPVLEEYNSGATYQFLALKYKVSYSTIYNNLQRIRTLR